jgi:CubicO group peptidase (beta-lactamase class C family)
VARACDTDLKSFAEEYLFAPLGAEVGDWTRDRDGYIVGHGEIRITARDMAKFGLLYLNDGEHDGNRVISANWVQDCLRTYSEDAWTTRVGRNFRDLGYGYLWWSARAGDRRYNLAWGHGGQLIVLVDELDMVIVVTADPLHGQHGNRPWNHEKENLNCRILSGRGER